MSPDLLQILTSYFTRLFPNGRICPVWLGDVVGEASEDVATAGEALHLADSTAEVIGAAVEATRRTNRVIPVHRLLCQDCVHKDRITQEKKDGPINLIQ